MGTSAEMMKSYPEVLTEDMTLSVLLGDAYQSIARYGDGDFSVIRGQRELYQSAEPALAYELGRYLREPVKGVLNAIPRQLDPVGGPYHYRWTAFAEANAGVIAMIPPQTLGSAYLSRMDSAPHLHTAAYWCSLARLWAGHDICLVRGSERSLTALKLLESPCPPRRVAEVLTPPRNAWNEFDKTLDAASKFERIVLCTGLVARPLTHALTLRGCRAFDLGHIGMYFDKGRPRPLAECR